MDNENKSFGFGTENAQESAPEVASEQTYGAGSEQTFGQQTYDAGSAQTFGQQTYDAGNAQTFGQQTYDAGNAQTFGQQTYDAGNAQTFGQQTYDAGNAQTYGAGNEQTYGAGNAQTFGQQTYDAGNAQTFGQQTYGTGSEQTFGQQTYGTGSEQTFGQQSYGSQAYGQQYGQANYGMGAAPVNANGTPMKNHFGLKMTFSIIEILTCCVCNPVSLILGIIGCVFTTKANNAYKESRWDEFKSAAKASSICLWIGGVIAAIYLLICGVYWVAYGDELTDAFWEGYYSVDSSDNTYNSKDDDDFSTDTNILGDNKEDDDQKDTGNTESTESTENTESTEQQTTTDTVITPGEGFTDPSIVINGVYVQLPLDYSDLKALGLYIESANEDYVANSNEYYYPDLYDASGKCIGAVYIGNKTDEAIPLKDGFVFGFDFNETDLESGDLAFSFSNGVTNASTKEDFKLGFGEPDYSYESEDSDYQSYQWYNHNAEYYDSSENSISITFWNGKLDSVTIMYRGWEE